MSTLTDDHYTFHEARGKLLAAVARTYKMGQRLRVLVNASIRWRRRFSCRVRGDRVAGTEDCWQEVKRKRR